MKKSELRKIIREAIKEQLATAPMKGDRPTPMGMTLYLIPCTNGRFKPPSGPISNMNTSIMPKALIDNRTPNQSDVGKTIQAEPGGNPANKSVIMKVEEPYTYQSPDTFNVYLSDNQCSGIGSNVSPAGRRPINKIRRK